MKSVISLFAAVWLAGGTLTAQAPAAAQDQPAAILKELSRITGLALIRPVQQETMSRDKLRQFFEQRLKEVVKPEEVRIEELTLKKFGFAPPEFNLEKTTVDLMTEQAAAFYDYRKKKMVMLDSAAGGGSAEALQQIALVHELAHALADQHFSLEKYLKKDDPNDDSTLARTAVMEGQATWLMSEFMAQKMGQSLKNSPMVAEMMSRAAAAGGGGFPVFDSVPLYMRESLLFPYTRGMQFQQQVVMKMGQQAFAEVFRNPPATTREILHPETYFAHQAAVEVKPPALENEKAWKKLSEGTIGEFDHMVLFKQYAPGQEELAAAWRGGDYQLWESKDGKNVALAYVSTWENAEKARAVFEAWQKAQQGKWKKRSVTETGAARVSGQGDDGYFVVRLEGSQVSVLEGMAERPKTAPAR